MNKTPLLDYANAIIAKNRKVKTANIIAGTIAAVAVVGSVAMLVERLTRTSDGSHNFKI